MAHPIPNRPGQGEWLARKLGTNKWVVASRLTARLKSKGYKIAISQSRFSELTIEFNNKVNECANHSKS